MRWWSSLSGAHSSSRALACVCAFAAAACASPVDFGMAELNAAIASRDFKYAPKVMAELDLQAPETYRIEPYAAGGGHITGGDLRGLMYGLLEAAEQMRSTGHLKQSHGAPALALRGLRIAAKPEAEWFRSTAFWTHFFEEMARDRFNRLEVSFDSAPSAEIAATVRAITDEAQHYAVEVAVGFNEPNPPAIGGLLRNCPAIRAVVLHGNAMLDESQLLRTLQDSGHRVVLELADSENFAGLIENAGQSGAPLRLFAPFDGSAVNPRPRDLYLEMDPSQGSDAVSTISGAGFEIAAPLGESGQPTLDSVATWGRSGYSRPAP